jgi:hypothetical protein
MTDEIFKKIEVIVNGEVIKGSGKMTFFGVFAVPGETNSRSLQKKVRNFVGPGIRITGVKTDLIRGIPDKV